MLIIELLRQFGKLLVRVSSNIHVRCKHLGLLLWTLVPDWVRLAGNYK